MCSIVLFPDGTEIASAGQLSDRLNMPIKKDDGYMTVDRDYCLCAVDVEAMLKEAGFEYEYDGDYIIKKPTP